MANVHSELVSKKVDSLVDYALRHRLIHEEDRHWATNSILDVLRLNAYVPVSGRPSVDSDSAAPSEQYLSEILDVLVDDALARNVLEEDTTTYRDLFDTALMGRLTPPPREVQSTFAALRSRSPKAATDWYYTFSKDTNYIRRNRLSMDVAWQADTTYGVIDLTINLAKPEKDPRAIAAARDMPSADYPLCQLCAENEGYSGRVNHPARQNHRIVPVTINESPWFLQYSPYVYYNEHCIVFSGEHTPMRIDRSTFKKLLDFVEQFPHYFVGSNADLPIVGGSILTHDHFQGGRFEFAMARAPIEQPVTFTGFDDISVGIVKWPMSVLRLSSTEPTRLVNLADKILKTWRRYSDETAFIFAETNAEPHNTITPIARRRENKFELDVVLRNNITTDEHPLGVYHPHAELHHLKKENIGLIEVMGLAVLPARLKEELEAVADAIITGTDLRANPLTEKHASWAERFAHQVCSDNAHDVVNQEVGKAFISVLEHAGVYKHNKEGRNAFLRFIDAVNET